MESFSMEIAGLVVGVYPLFQSTKEYCRPYLTKKEPEFIVQVATEDLILEQIILEQEAIEEGLKIRKFKEPFLERSVIQRRVADQLIRRNTVMLHGSTVAVDGQAYLFTAPCGTGKSTHTRLWRELFGERAVMVNDDKPFLKITSEGVLAYGSPWSGKHGLASNLCVPLSGICLLHRGSENTIHRLACEHGISFLRKQVHIPLDASLVQDTLSLTDKLAKTVPLWEMSCNKEQDAAMVSYFAMRSDKGILQWVDYDDKYAQLVDSWLDHEAISMTGLDTGWDVYWEAVKDDAVNFQGCKDFCKVILDNGIPCAAVCFGIFQNTLTISEIVVDPRFRGRRIGTKVLAELVNMAKNHTFDSLNRLTAVIYPQNVASQKAFRNAGFHYERKTDDGVDLIYSYIL